MILDAYVVIAFVLDESAGDAAERVLRAGPWTMTAPGLAETVDEVARASGADASAVVAALLGAGLIETIDLDTGLAVAAGVLRARHYHRTRRSVSLADCVLAAAAQSRRDTVATSDPHLLDLCHDEGIAVEVLPGSDGSVWTPR